MGPLKLLSSISSWGEPMTYAPMHAEVKASTSHSAYFTASDAMPVFIPSFKTNHERDAPLKQDMVDLMELD